MRQFIAAAAIIGLATQWTLSAPTSSGQNPVSSARTLQMPEAASASLDNASARAVDKGKRKLIDFDAQLNEYLAEKQPRRNQGIVIGGPRQRPATPRPMISRQILEAPSANPAAQAGQISSQGAKRKGRGYYPLARWEDRVTKRGGKAKLQKARREAFNRIWHEQGLHLETDPIKLAGKVIAMAKEDGIDASSSRALAARLVKSKQDPVFEKKYLPRIQRLNKYLSVERKNIANDHYMSKLGPRKQQEHAIDATFKAVAKFDKKQKAKAALGSAAPLAVKKQYQMTVKNLGTMLREHLKGKKLDFHNMPLRQLVDESQVLALKTRMGQRPFTRALYRYLRFARGDTEEALAEVTRARKKFPKG